MPPRIIPTEKIDKIQLKIAFSHALRKRLVEAAEKQGRSMTAEIINRLEESFVMEDAVLHREQPKPWDNPFGPHMRNLIYWLGMEKRNKKEIDDFVSSVILDAGKLAMEQAPDEVARWLTLSVVNMLGEMLAEQKKQLMEHVRQQHEKKK